MTQFQFSKFTHILERNEIAGYYHALHRIPVFADREFRDPLEVFRHGCSRNGFLEQFPGRDNRSLAAALFDSLLENGILITDPRQDEAEQTAQHKKIGTSYIDIAFFLLTNDCNFACKYCFVREPMQQNHQPVYMTRETALKGLNLYTRLIHSDPTKLSREKALVFYGGEPLMNFPVLKFILEKISEYKGEGKLPAHLRPLVVTNGSLMTAEIANFLKTHQVTVTFSLDGPEAANCNRLLENGKPAFPSIVRGLRICQSREMDLNIACTLTPQNLVSPERTIESFTKDYRVKRLGFNMLLDNDIMETSPDYNLKASEFIIQAHRKLRKAGIRENRMSRRLQAFHNGGVCLHDCMAAAGREMAIAPTGEIGICHEHMWDGLHTISHVNDLEFNPAENEVYREWMSRTPLNMEQCQNCMALGICGGGCPVNAENHGSIWELDERFCVQCKTILEWLIWDAYETATEEKV